MAGPAGDGSRMPSQQDMRTVVAQISRELDADGKLDWAQAFLDGNFMPKKKGDGVGYTQRGNGSKVMVVADGNGLLIRLNLHNAQHHEITLALMTILRQGVSFSHSLRA